MKYLANHYMFYCGFSLVMDNWERVCDMSKPLVHTSIPGKIYNGVVLIQYILWMFSNCSDMGP